MPSTSITQFIENRTRWLVDRTSEFIRIPSLSGDEKEVARLLLRCLTEAGLTGYTDEAGNVIAALEGSRCSGEAGTGKTLAFNVHLDTVPPGTAASWTFPPFSGMEKEGKIYGRGASDTKGAWGPIILAMEAVKRCGVRIRGQVVFTAVVMEELGLCAGMRTLLESTLRDSPPDYMILGEPTSLGIALGHKGKTELEIVTEGKACHASVPWQGDNALYRAAPVIAAMERLAGELGRQAADPLFGRTSLALTDIGCNPGVRNIIPDTCTMAADCRFPPGETAESVKAGVEAFLRAEGLDARVSVSLEDRRTYTGLPAKGARLIPSFGIEDTHPLVTQACRGAAAVLGKNPRLFRWDFATDGGWSMGRLGIPTIGFSPCEEHLAHTVDEHVRIDYMVTAAKVYAAMIEEILGVR